jgi:trehalose-6-phosphate synthase
MFRSAQHDRVR